MPYEATCPGCRRQMAFSDREASSELSAVCLVCGAELAGLDPRRAGMSHTLATPPFERRLVVGQVLGKGGQGTVFRVRTQWGVEIATKILRVGVATAREAILREALTSIKVGRHPNVVACHAVEPFPWGMTIDLELVSESVTLGDLIGRRDRPGALYKGGPDAALKRILDIAIQTAWGLAFLHGDPSTPGQPSLIHQDFKPPNVLVNNRCVAKVTDLGMAHLRNASTDPSQPVPPEFGTFLFQSPEQADGQKLTSSTDVWSWALTVFAMFAGEADWKAGSRARSSFERYVNGTVSNPGRPEIPRALRELLFGCLEEDARRRSPIKRAIEVVEEVYREHFGSYPRRAPSPTRESADGVNNRAVSLHLLGKHDEARALFDKARTLDPAHLWSTYNKAVVGLRSGAYTRRNVESAFTAAREAHPEHWHRELVLAWLKVELADPAAAARHFRSAAALALRNNIVLALPSTQSEVENVHEAPLLLAPPVPFDAIGRLDQALPADAPPVDEGRKSAPEPREKASSAADTEEPRTPPGGEKRKGPDDFANALWRRILEAAKGARTKQPRSCAFVVVVGSVVIAGIGGTWSFARKPYYESRCSAGELSLAQDKQDKESADAVLGRCLSACASGSEQGCKRFSKHYLKHTTFPAANELDRLSDQCEQQIGAACTAAGLVRTFQPISKSTPAGEELKSARDELRTACDLRDATACHYLAVYEAWALGGSRTENEGIKHLRSACKFGTDAPNGGSELPSLWSCGKLAFWEHHSATARLSDERLMPRTCKPEEDPVACLALGARTHARLDPAKPEERSAGDKLVEEAWNKLDTECQRGAVDACRWFYVADSKDPRAEGALNRGCDLRDPVACAMRTIRKGDAEASKKACEESGLPIVCAYAPTAEGHEALCEKTGVDAACERMDERQPSEPKWMRIGCEAGSSKLCRKLADRCARGATEAPCDKLTDIVKTACTGSVDACAGLFPLLQQDDLSGSERDNVEKALKEKCRLAPRDPEACEAYGRRSNTQEGLSALQFACDSGRRTACASIFCQPALFLKGDEPFNRCLGTLRDLCKGEGDRGACVTAAQIVLQLGSSLTGDVKPYLTEMLAHACKPSDLDGGLRGDNKKLVADACLLVSLLDPKQADSLRKASVLGHGGAQAVEAYNLLEGGKRDEAEKFAVAACGKQISLGCYVQTKVLCEQSSDRDSCHRELSRVCDDLLDRKTMPVMQVPRGKEFGAELTACKEAGLDDLRTASLTRETAEHVLTRRLKPACDSGHEDACAMMPFVSVLRDKGAESARAQLTIACNQNEKATIAAFRTLAERLHSSEQRQITAAFRLACPKAYTASRR